MKKRDGYIDARPWLVVQAPDGRAEIHYDRGEPGLVILEEGRYWREKDAVTHRDAYNRRRAAEKRSDAVGPGEAVRATISAVPPTESTEDVAVLGYPVVEMLEELLEKARRGEFRAAAVALVHIDGGTSDRWAYGRGRVLTSLVGAIRLMEARFLTGLVEKTNPGSPE